MSKSYKKIYSGNTIEVHRFCDELESININPVVKDPEESARLGGFGAFYTDKEYGFTKMNLLKLKSF